MWRLLAIGFMGLAIWGANALLPASRDEEQLRSLTSIATQGSDSVAVAPQTRTALASPSDAQAAAAIVTPVSDPAVNLARSVVLQSLTAAQAAGTEPLLVKSNPPAVTATSAQQPKTMALEMALELPATFLPVTEADAGQGKLVTRLQEQLRRVGCYRGAVDGNWSPATRRAMARFNDRINAQIDLDTVRPALLTLVETYGNRACGQACLPGTTPNAAGVCVTGQSVASAVPPTVTVPAVSAPAAVNVAALGTPKTPTLPAPATARTSASAVGTAAPAPAAPTVIASRSVAATLQHPAQQTVSLGSTTLTASNAWTPSIEVAVAKPMVQAPALSVAITVAAVVPAPVPPKAIALTAAAVPVAAPKPIVDAQAPAPAVRTTIVTLAPARTKKKVARKSSGWGNAQYAFGASDPAPAPRRTHRRLSGTWADAFYSGSIVLSKRFVGGTQSGWGEGLAIVTSRH